MQPRVLFATLVVALLSCFSRFSSWISGCSQRCSRASYSRLSRPSNLAARRSAPILFRFETLLAFGDFGALFTSLAIRAVLAFGLERLAALVLATVLVTSAGTVASGASTVFRETVAALAMPATRIARRLGLLKRPTETRFGTHSPTNSNTSGESWVTSIGLTFSPASCSMRRVRRRWFGRTMVTTSPEWPARAVRPER